MTARALWLNDAALDALDITPGEMADAIEVALAEKSAGRLRTAPKSVILPGDGRYSMVTLALDDDLAVVKQASVSPGNAARGLPDINGAILVLDGRTGLLRGVLGANWVTARRTAALSLAAARRLADPASRVIAFVGTGVQASSHLEAFAAAFPLSEVRAVGRGRKNIERLCHEAENMGYSARAFDDPATALGDADIVVTSVTLDYSVAPFLDARWMKPGAFASITDLAIPWHPGGMRAFGTLVVDDIAQEKSAERPLVDAGLVSGDLTTLVVDRHPIRRTDAPNAFVFRGIALGDHAAAALALRRAEAAGAGVPLDL